MRSIATMPVVNLGCKASIIGFLVVPSALQVRSSLRVDKTEISQDWAKPIILSCPILMTLSKVTIRNCYDEKAI